ncbi:MAG: hypothetical protein ACTTGJ_00320 [Clostridium sp.]
MEDFIKFIKENKYTLIIAFVAIIVILFRLTMVIIDVIFFVGALLIGLYIDKNENKVKEIIEKLRKDKEN